MNRFAPGFSAVAITLLLHFGVNDAYAQTAAWPTKVVRMVVVFPPGGGSDLVARLLAPKLSAAFGQQFIVENRPGASGIIGSTLVARSAPDGNVLLLSNVGSHAIAPTLNKNTEYDPVRDFTHIALLGSTPHVLLVHAGVPVKTLADLVALSKAQPGKLNYGSGGTGSINHVAGELLKTKVGLDLTHVSYKGSAAAIAELRGRHISAAVDALPANVGAIRSGELRALVTMSSARSPMAPDVPTAIELGYRDVLVENWIGISGPANLPREVVDRLAGELQRILQMPDIRDMLETWGVAITFKNQGPFTQFVREDLARWRPVVAASGARIE